jgi:transcription initiation factor TFIID subunit 10
MASNTQAENPEQASSGPNGTQGEHANGSGNGSGPAAAPESRLPTRKDASLKEFLNKMDDYAPIVRTAMARHGWLT